MPQDPREKWSEYLALGCSIIPAMIANGFMPLWNVLPMGAWLFIAVVGSAVAGTFATPRSIRGLLAGADTGLGIFAGIGLYVWIRSAIGGHQPIRKAELVIGGLIGWAPGLLLYHKWAKASD